MKARRNPRGTGGSPWGTEAVAPAALRSHRHNLFGAEALSIRLNSFAIVGNDHMRAAACQDRLCRICQRAKLFRHHQAGFVSGAPAEGHLRQAHSDHALCLDREHRGIRSELQPFIEHNQPP